MIRGALLDFMITSFHIGVVGTIHWGVARAAPKTDLSPSARRAVVWGFCGFLWAWLAVVIGMAKQGVFVAQRAEFPTALLVTILVPTAIGLAALAMSSTLRRFIDQMPPQWPSGVQVFRIGGTIFLLIWLQGDMPAAFALPAAIGDTIVAGGALLVARSITRRSESAWLGEVAWGIAGILIVTMIVSLGFLTSPCSIQALALDQPNVLISSFPLVITGLYIGPLAVFLHAVVIRDGMRRRDHVA